MPTSYVTKLTEKLTKVFYVIPKNVLLQVWQILSYMAMAILTKEESRLLKTAT